MKPAFRRLALVILLLPLAGTLLGCANREKRDPITFDTQPWQYGRFAGVQLTTDHYKIYTTLDEPMLTNALPEFAERFYEHCATLIPPSHQPDDRAPIYVFTTRGQWEAFTRRFTGDRAHLYLQVRNGGYSERGTAVIEYVTHQATFALLAHEGFHQYVALHVESQLPAWLNEGLAVYVEGQRWTSRGLDRFDPYFNPRRRNTLARATIADRLHPLEKLLRTHAGEVIQETSQSVLTYYAQVWALVLFLQDGADGKYAPGFQRLLDALHDSELSRHARAAHIWSQRPDYSFGEELFRSFISEDLDTIEREYLAFIKDNLITYAEPEE